MISKNEFFQGGIRYLALGCMLGLFVMNFASTALSAEDPVKYRVDYFTHHLMQNRDIESRAINECKSGKIASARKLHDNNYYNYESIRRQLVAFYRDTDKSQKELYKAEKGEDKNKAKSSATIRQDNAYSKHSIVKLEQEYLALKLRGKYNIDSCEVDGVVYKQQGAATVTHEPKPVETSTGSTETTE